jgi:hypothetical protein
VVKFLFGVRFGGGGGWRRDCCLSVLEIEIFGTFASWHTYILCGLGQFSVMGGMRCGLREDDKHSMYHRVHHTTWKVTPLRKCHTTEEDTNNCACRNTSANHSALRPANHTTIVNPRNLSIKIVASVHHLQSSYAATQADEASTSKGGTLPVAGLTQSKLRNNRSIFLTCE